MMGLRRKIALWLCPDLTPVKPVVVAEAAAAHGPGDGFEYECLLALFERYAAHVDRSETTVAKWAGAHARLVTRLRDNKGCNVDTYNQVMRWFDQTWPADLPWPADIPRPSRKKDAA